MANESVITAERLRAIVDYNPDTGQFFWKARTPEMFTPDGRRSVDGICSNWNAKWAGKLIRGRNGDGYRFFRVDRRVIYAHRAAWFLMNGQWPAHQIDHIDGNPANNRIANLRPAEISQNHANRRTLEKTKSGIKGVRWDRGKWCAQITVNGRYYYLGRFISIDDARAAYHRAAVAHFGEYARCE